MTGFVYAIKSTDFVKIGFSRNPKSRLKQAATFNPHPVKLLGFYEATIQDEYDLHERFKQNHVRNEWYYCVGVVDAWCQNLTYPPKKTILDTWLEQKRGRKIQLAKTLGITRAAMHQWLTVPAIHCPKIESVTGISRAALRPDVFGVKEPAE